MTANFQPHLRKNTMNKLSTLLLAAVALAITLTFTGCNSFTHMMKDLESDFSELERDITVLNAITGDTVFTYSGPCYISEGSSSGDITLIFKRNGVAKKADFIGEHIIFVATEK